MSEAGRSRLGGRAQQEAPYLDALLDYAEAPPGRFHVPGHKGGPGADPAWSPRVRRAAFDHDIPAVIEGIDIGRDSRSSGHSGSRPRPGAPIGAGS